MTKSSCLIAVVSLFVGLSAHGQIKSPLEKTLDNLQKQAADYPLEKVYLHLDKPCYGAGDTIWFKAYTVIGAAHQLSTLSCVLNVELINGQNSIVKQLKLSLQDGLGNGDIPLGDTISAGNYRIRAYTNWMRNFGEEYFFDKNLPIVNPVTNNVATNTDYSYMLNTVNAVISYADLAGKPFAGKPVSYDVRLGSKSAAKSSGVTDGEGKLHITFNQPAGNATTGEIATAIQLDKQTIIRKNIPIKGTSRLVDVQFFPESGQLVNDVVCKVGFKAIGGDGLGAAIKGTIVDNQLTEVTTFASTHLGMGTFFLTPQAGKSYKAIVDYADGSRNTVDLPKAADNGYMMAIHSDSANVVVKITQKGHDSDSAGVMLVARNQGDVFLQAKGSSGKATFTAVIPKSKLPTGIVQFTLFSGTGELLNERLVFVQNDDLLKIAANTDQPAYQTRQKVKMKLQVKNEAGKPVTGDFSVAVIDESKVSVNETTENSILANLLLTSELRGYIEQPNYYFANNNKTTAADLDVLMLTQGYHRYEWKDAISGTVPVINYRPEKGILLAGMLKDRSGMAVTKSKVTLLSNTTPPVLIDTITDGKGRFAFNLDFKDGSQFTLKTASAGNADARFKFDRPLIAVGPNKNFADIQINPDKWLEPYLKNDKLKYDAEVKYGVGNHSALLKEVKINTSRPKTERELKIEKAVEFSSNLNGAGNADQVLTAEDFEGMGCKTYEECLAGRLGGIVFINGWPMLNRSVSLGGRQTMLIMVDGVVAFVDKKLPAESQLPQIETVSSVEVLRSGMFTAMYGTRGAAGVLVITTKHGNGFLNDVGGDGGTIKPQGFYNANVFYSPKYEVAKPDAAIPDMRSTIYWNPSIQTDDEGNASFNFYNADGKGQYRVIIEGIDKSGSLGRKVLEYKVD